MYHITLDHNLPDMPINWPDTYAAMVDSIREWYTPADIIISVKVDDRVVALAQVQFEDDIMRLNVLVSVFPDAGNKALGTALSIAHARHSILMISSRHISVGFYRHCRALLEVRSHYFAGGYGLLF